jgi:hypothetical protein
MFFVYKTNVEGMIMQCKQYVTATVILLTALYERGIAGCCFIYHIPAKCNTVKGFGEVLKKY